MVVAAAGLTELSSTGLIGVIFVFSVEFFGLCRTLSGFAGLCPVVAIPRVWRKYAFIGVPVGRLGQVCLGDLLGALTYVYFHVFSPG